MKKEHVVVAHERDEIGDVYVADDVHFRDLYFESDVPQSRMLRSHPDLLVLAYSQVMSCALIFLPLPRRVLMVGLGGGSLAKFLIKAVPDLSLHVYESRAIVTAMAHNYFALPKPSPTLSIHCEDGLAALSKKITPSQNDIIFLDAFDVNGPAPALVKTETIMAAQAKLAKDGLLCISLWNRKADLFQQALQLISDVFEGRVIQYELGKIDSNVIVFCYQKGLNATQLSLLEYNADQLNKRWGLRSLDYLQAFRKQNEKWNKKLVQ